MDRKDLVPVLTVQNPMKAETRGFGSRGDSVRDRRGESGGICGVAAMGIDVMTHAEDVKRACKHLRCFGSMIARFASNAWRSEGPRRKPSRLKNAIQEIKLPDQIQPPPNRLAVSR